MALTLVALLWNQKKIRESMRGYWFMLQDMTQDPPEELVHPQNVVFLKSADLHKGPGSPLPRNFPVEQVGIVVSESYFFRFG